ncbi:MAG: DUF4298 domain-containing protein, partial [Gammaproteobacteria bacterium]|nr:DUF4298 domain-containing protein [Gammaproteobacteria bacterium]
NQMKKLEQIKSNCQAIDNILLQAEKDFKEIQQISERLQIFSEKMEQLENFYFNDDWQKNRELLEQHNQDDFYCTSEDGIWNLSVAYREERIKLIKQLVQEL